MSNKRTNIADALDIIPVQKKNEVETIETPEVDTSEDDEIIDSSINNLQDIVEKAKEALGEITVIATSTEEPKAFAALSSILNAAVSANKELERAARDRKKEKQALQNNSSEGHTLVNNGNVYNYYGTTDDLAQHVSEIEGTVKKEEE